MLFKEYLEKNKNWLSLYSLIEVSNSNKNIPTTYFKKVELFEDYNVAPFMNYKVKWTEQINRYVLQIELEKVDA